MGTHIEEFAERLRLIKERSGRSYGTLAARLHVSTSTLHRYCNGTAVPAEYAPVERFARQCGASAEELVALHQLWLLAAAARRLGSHRSPQPAEPSGAEPAASGSQEGADAPAGTSPSDPVVRSVDASSAPASQEPRRSRRRAGLVVLAVAVLVAALPLTLRTLHGGEHPRDDPTLSPPQAGATVRPSPSETTSPSGAPSTPPTERTKPTEAVSDSGKPPVQVTVLSDNWDSQCDQWFLLQQPPAQVPPLPSLQQTNAWAAALNGVPAQDLRLQLTVQGRPGEPVVLHALYVKVVSSAAAPAGNGYTLSSGCGGGLDPASFAVDLDATVPRARAVSGFDGGDHEPPVDFPLQVSASDAEVLDVDAHTLDHDVSWYLDLVWSSGARQGTLRIDDHGRPFRMVGLKGDPRYYYTGTSWAPDDEG